jgi:low affinity Fe/Cu permease
MLSEHTLYRAQCSLNILCIRLNAHWTFSEHWALYKVHSVSIEPYTKYVQSALSPIQSMFSEHWALYKVHSVSIEPYTKYVQWALSPIQSTFSEHWALYKVHSVSIEPYTKYVQWALSPIQSMFLTEHTLYKAQCSLNILCIGLNAHWTYFV